MLIDEQPTTGELLLIYRWRNKESQVSMAAKLGVSLKQYRQIELDAVPPPKVPPGLKKIKLTKQDELRLWRKRSGLTLLEIGRAINRCAYWVSMMERGSVDNEKLVTFYESHGNAVCPTN